MTRQPHDVGTDTESHEVAALMAGGMSQLDASRSVYDVGAFVPRNLRCDCTDVHHYRGSAKCPLTPADPWDPDLGGAA